MHISFWDIAIIICYFVLMIGVGFYVSNRSKKNMDSYFLSGKKLPWYILGVSDASGMYDIAGTMWMVTNAFIYGVKSLYLIWIWPVFNQVFLMVFMSPWVRRSNVMTGAQWIETRFSRCAVTEATNVLMVLFAIIATFGYFAYGFIGIGKFVVEFLPWDLSFYFLGFHFESYQVYAIIITILVGLYATKGGLFSVVVTEVMQFGFTLLISLIVGVVAISKVSHRDIMEVVPPGWDSIIPPWHLSNDWHLHITALSEKMNSDNYSWFTIIVMLMLCKGVLNSVAGPVPGYDMQRILATKSPSEAGKMSGFVSMALLVPRFIFVTGITALALKYVTPNIPVNGSFDFEEILPLAINNCIPVGIAGLVLAGLLAAFMSNFSATVNASPAYLVNDIYKKYIYKSGIETHYVKASYIASLAMLFLGIFAGMHLSSINAVMQWLFAGLYGGYVSANILKWIWWRFNSHGYFYGMLVGIVCAIIAPLVAPGISPLLTFPFTFLASLAACIIASLLSKPDDEITLKNFVRQVRPWGFWKPIKEKLAREEGLAFENTFRRDMTNCAVGIVWQVSLMGFGMYIVIQEFVMAGIMLVAIIVTSLYLRKNWWLRLED